MKLYIAEKRELAQVVASALGVSKATGIFFEGDDFKVTWLSGHLLRLGDPEEHDDQYEKWGLESLPMDWPVTYKPEEKHKDHVAKIVNEIKSSSGVQIYNVGDPDPSGQRIVDEIIEYAGKNPDDAMRVLINDNNPDQVLKALSDERSNREFKGISQSELARAVSDQRYGYNLTRLYTLLARKKGYQNLLSVGRVQTPLLGLVVARDRAHESHAKQLYFSVHAEVALDGIVLDADYIISDTDPVDDSGRLSDFGYVKELAASVAGRSAKIVNVETKSKTVSPPLPHNLLSLQAEAAGLYNLKPGKVMEITQQLRDDHRCITYNRVDSRYLVDERHSEAPELIAGLGAIVPQFTKGCDASIKSKAFNSAKVTAHHAIIPTASIPSLYDLSDDQKKVYLLIAKYYLAQFYPPETYRTTSVLLDVEGCSFRAVGRVDQDSGWRVLFKDDDQDSDGDDDERLNLENLKKGELGKVKSSEYLEHKTKPPARYTMKSLLLDLTRVARHVTDPEIKKLLVSKDADKEGESGGIGTPATRDSHIETLFTRGFIAEEKKAIISTSVGREFHDALPDFAVKPDLTALWHEKQKQIEEGGMNYRDLINDVDRVIAAEVERAKHTGLTIKTNAFACPSCEDGFIVSRVNYDKKHFWSCTNYPACKKTFEDDQGKPDFDGKKQEKGPDCKECENGVMVRKKSAKGFFWGCSGYPECKATMQDNKGKPVKKKKVKLSKHSCPECDKKLVRRESVKSKSKNTHWWGCSGFPVCKFTATDKEGSPVLEKKKKKADNDG